MQISPRASSGAATGLRPGIVNADSGAVRATGAAPAVVPLAQIAGAAPAALPHAQAASATAGVVPTVHRQNSGAVTDILPKAIISGPLRKSQGESQDFSKQRISSSALSSSPLMAAKISTSGSIIKSGAQDQQEQIFHLDPDHNESVLRRCIGPLSAGLADL